MVLAEIDAGANGASRGESAEIKRLKAENRRRREDNEILRKGSISFFARELDPRTGDPGVHRRHAQPVF